ncbi:putative ATP-dependent helicase [Tenacibaculum phage JQ]|nr:putative ATP-dependent helicase [Tenacibaculum phage JQ]
MEINGFEVLDYNIYGIPAKAKSHTCPKCSHTRKKKTDKCMSVFWDTGLGQCNHCGETIQLHTYKKREVIKEFVKPKHKNVKSEFSDVFLKYAKEHRCISEKTLKRLKITQGIEWMPKAKKEVECIMFNYYLDNELINIKYRAKNKDFKLYKDAEKIFYNLDSIKTSKEAVIVEGEWDCVSFVEAGINNVVSVPNGFNLKGETHLDYLDDYTEYFENKDVIYLAVDNDEAGAKGQKELIRRLGAEKCKIVDFKDCKDADEYSNKYGYDALIETLKSAKDVKIEGIFNAYDVRESMYNSYKNGQKRGTTTYVNCIDKAWTWRGGEVNLWTGYQNEGKSLMLNQLCAIRAINEDAKVGVFSPENMPIDDFYNDIIEMVIGKSVDPYYKDNYMSEDEFYKGLKFCQDNFFLIYPEKDFKLESIFERAKYLVKKKGIRTIIIDPYNTVEHKIKAGEREDLYISRFMANLKRFAVEYDLSVNLVAHQTTARVNEKDGGRYYKPSLNNIKGGGTFADKADNVLIVWRPNRALDFKDREVVFASQKIKKQKLVGRPQDVVNIYFDIKTNRYNFNGEHPLNKDYRKNDNEPIPTATIEEAFGSEDDVPF